MRMRAENRVVLAVVVFGAGNFTALTVHTERRITEDDALRGLQNDVGLRSGLSLCLAKSRERGGHGGDFKEASSGNVVG